MPWSAASYSWDCLVLWPHVLQVDLAPIAVRRSAFKAVGGLDEGMSDRGECGIWWVEHAR